MIGSIKTNRSGIVSRSGFKYLRFEPGVNILPGSDTIEYKNKTYKYEDLIYIQFEENDIQRETMSAITLSNCKILDRQLFSGQCKTQTGYRSLALTPKLELFPIIKRLWSGSQPDRRDTFGYCSDEYIIITCKWDRDSVVYEVKQNGCEVEYTSENVLESLSPYLRSFVNKSKRCHSVLSEIPWQNANLMNVCHLNRFKLQYQEEFKTNYNIDLDMFGTMDVIDLNNITEIKVTGGEGQFDFDDYPVFEFLPNTIIYKGSGLNSTLSENLEDNSQKFYCILIGDAVSHHIEFHSYAILHINKKNTRVACMKDEPYNKPGLLFLKFNKSGLIKFLRNTIVINL